MVYDWENKEAICYKLYIEEKKPLEEIMEILKREFKFTPSKRAYQTQFKRWEFPSKQNPAHKNTALVARVKELWERNVSQREMLSRLNEEGFEIKERELMRVRAKNRWLLRVPNGMKGKDGMGGPVGSTAKRNDREGGDGALGELQAALMDGEVEASEGNTPGATAVRAASPELSPEVLAKRMERLEKLQAESAVRWASRKRRRRTRGWAGLPADPPGPPRFPSETTIDESKAFLSLDSHLYRDIRARFQRICEDAGVLKKTVAGPERWEAVKSMLISESTHLSAVFYGPGTDNAETNGGVSREQKKLALDVVCTDVTKRMRTLERRMTIAEAKNCLGINPEESRGVRNAFYRILKEDAFTSKLEAGDEHWRELKRRWVDGSELLQGILQKARDADQTCGGRLDENGEGDTTEKVRKAMEVLCRDVMKRLRDDQTKRDPTRRRKWDSAQTVALRAQAEAQASNPSQSEAQDMQQMAGPALPQYTQPQQQNHLSPVQQQQQSYTPLSPQRHRPAPQRHSSSLDHQISQYGSITQPHDALVAAAAHAQAQAQAQAEAQRQMAAQQQTQAQVMGRGWEGDDDMRIDPSLLLATAGEGMLDHSQSHHSQHQAVHSNHYSSDHYADHTSQHQQYSPQSYAALPAQHHQQHHHQVSQGSGVSGPTGPMAVYFRLHTSSDVSSPSRLWVATLSTITVRGVREEAVRKWPGCVVGRLEGVVKDTGGTGEVTLVIETDEELGAYLDAVGGVKPVFCVQVLQAGGMGGMFGGN